MLLNFVVNDTEFRCLNPSVASTADVVDYVKCHFDITALADVDAVVAMFKSASYNQQYEVLLDSNGNCYMDPDVYRRGGVVQIKLLGDRYGGEAVHHSTYITPVLEVLFNDRIVVPTATPSKYDIFVAELEKAEAAVEAAMATLQQKLDDGDFDGADGVGIASVTYNQNGTVNVTLSDGSSFTSSYSMKGAPGDDGADGVGISNIVYNQDGTVTITLTDGTQFISAYSMKGEQGERGPQGETGEDGVGIVRIVKTGTSGLVDTYTVTYTNGYTTTFTVTNGVTPSISAAATGLAAGASPTVTKSGTDAAPTFTFGIPKGDKGDTGLGVTDVVASEYSASSTYAVDDYVLYNNHLYRCTTAITTAEAWTAAHWTEIVLCDEFTDLKDDLSGLVGALATEETQQTIEGETDSIVGLLQQIVEQGHSSGDLNGYSLNPGAGDELLITYKNPEDETDTVTIVAPTNTTMTAIASALADLADTWKGVIITNG